MIVMDGIIFSLQQAGGVSTYFRELLSHSVKAQLPVHLTYYGEHPPLDIAGTRLHPRILERYRRCQLPVAGSLFHSSYYRLPQDSSVPVVTTVYDFVYEKYVTGARRLVHSWQKFKAIKHSSAIICISNNTKQDLLEFVPGIDEKKVSVVYIGCSDSYFRLEETPDEVPPYVLFVGSRAGYKNFPQAVEAISKIGWIELVCVGGGAFNAFESELLEKKLKGRYRQELRASEERLNCLYNKAFCLLYPSSYEGFGIPPLEAMRAGCPVVAVHTSSIPEVVGDAACLVEAPDPDLFADAIARLSDSSFRYVLQEKGFRQSMAFSWDRAFEETLAVYERAADTKFLQSKPQHIEM